jgi:uncharacterized ferredoxin-like protein
MGTCFSIAHSTKPLKKQKINNINTTIKNVDLVDGVGNSIKIIKIKKIDNKIVYEVF